MLDQEIRISSMLKATKWVLQQVVDPTRNIFERRAMLDQEIHISGMSKAAERVLQQFVDPTRNAFQRKAMSYQKIHTSTTSKRSPYWFMPILGVIIYLMIFLIASAWIHHPRWCVGRKTWSSVHYKFYIAWYSSPQASETTVIKINRIPRSSLMTKFPVAFIPVAWPLWAISRSFARAPRGKLFHRPKNKPARRPLFLDLPPGD